jgi:Cu(I)/Ag(I) efflux system membrane fusion protein
MTEKSITANGYIAFDERRNNKVSVRSSGRIERLYIKYDYQYVKKGERIADLYSPELSTYQKEYLFLLKSKEDSLITQAREKLKLLGLSESQIKQVEQSGVIASTIAISSPEDGFIRFTSDVPASGEMEETASTEMGSIQEASVAPNSPSNSQIREGVYVSKGQTLFVVNDCRQVWAILSVDISSQGELKKGEPVMLYSEMQTEKVKATIDFIEPAYKGKQRFTQARVYLDNPLRTFKINSLIHGELSTQTKALTVPLSSVYDLGSQKIVWVKMGVTSNGSGVFEPKVVMTGIATNNSIEIISGLSGEEEIALDAGYMIDSESILKQAP